MKRDSVFSILRITDGTGYEVSLWRATAFGLAAGVISLFVPHFITSSYATILSWFGPVSVADTGPLASWLLLWGMTFVLFFASAASAILASRTGVEIPELTGALTGMFVAIGQQGFIALAADYGRIAPLEFLLYIAVCIPGGLIGGFLVRLLAATSRAFSHADEQIRAASEPGDILRHLVETLPTNYITSASIWEVLSGPPDPDTVPLQSDGLARNYSRNRGDSRPAGTFYQTYCYPEDAAKISPEHLALPGPDQDSPALSRMQQGHTIIAPIRDGATTHAYLVLSLGRRARIYRPDSRLAHIRIAGASATRIVLLRVVDQRNRLARRQMGRDVHDLTAQGYVAILREIETEETNRPQHKEIPGQPDHEIDHEPNPLVRVREIAKQYLANTRDLISRAHHDPSQSRTTLKTHYEGSEDGKVGLTESLRSIARTPGGPVPVHLSLPDSPEGEQEPDLDDQTAANLLAIATEAVANAQKHANSKAITITLTSFSDALTLDVHDDGVGFSRQSNATQDRDADRGAKSGATQDATPGTESGYGIANMTHRVEELGGTLLVESTPGIGTIVSVEIPLDPVLSGSGGTDH